MSVPVGGLFVFYRYAEVIGAMGHRATVVHPWSHWRPPVRQWPECGAAVVAGLANPGRIVPWHAFSKDVRLRLIPWLSSSFLPKADITLLSGWQTSERICRATPRSGPLVQLVHDYELWATAPPEEQTRIAAALSHPGIVRIAASRAVGDMLSSFGATAAATITSGLDTDRFKVLVDPRKRKTVIGFSARPGANRGIEDAVAAFELLREALPQIEVQCFGSLSSASLPAWVHHFGYVPDNEMPSFYNRCAVFVLPSHFEGWGLPAAEAMACGAAVVTTANGGTADFAIDGLTALVVPPRDPSALASAVQRLIDDTPLRLTVAAAGVQRASSMSWELSASTLLQLLSTVSKSA